MCRVSLQLRELVKQRLDAAAEEIFELLERTITEYEEHLVSRYEQQRLQGALDPPVLPELTPRTPDLPAAPTLKAEEQTLEERPEPEQEQEQEQSQTANAQGPVKEEQLLLSISQTFVKEEPVPPVNDAQLTCAQVKKERPQSQALCMLFIKQEETEQSITPTVPPDPPNGPNTTPLGLNQDQSQDPNQNPYPVPVLNQDLKSDPAKQKPEKIQDQNVDQNPNQDQDLNQDFEEEENVEWEFEGLSPPGLSPPRLSPPGASPDETENSSEEEETFPPNHPPKLLHFKTPRVWSSGQTSSTIKAPTNVLQNDEETTENSSDLSDSETTTSKRHSQNMEKDGKSPPDCTAQTEEVRVVTNNTLKTLNFPVKEKDQTDTTTTQAKKQKQKRLSWTKRSKNPEESHMKTHSELVPCPVCGKMFKKKGYLFKHMKSHQSQSESKKTVHRTGKKRKAKHSEASAMLEKRRKVTDPDLTEDSSDEH